LQQAARAQLAHEGTSSFFPASSLVEGRNTEVSGGSRRIADRNRRVEHSIWLVDENNTGAEGRHNHSPLARHNTRAEVHHSHIPVGHRNTRGDRLQL
jgi:hypothetical protein